MTRIAGSTDGTQDGQAPLGGGAWFVLGAAVPGGWILHDLVVFLTCGEPQVVLDLVPASLGLVLAGGLLAAGVARLPRPIALSFAVAAIVAGAALPALVRLQVSSALRAFPRVVAVLVLASLAAAWLARRAWIGPGRAGLVLGALAAAAVHRYRDTFHELSPLVISGAVLALACGLLPRPRPRHLATGLVLIGAAFPALRRAWLDASLTPVALPPASTEPAAAPSLLLIVLDTVRADRLSVYGGERPTTPALARFAEERCVVYEEARSTSSWTLPSHASLLTGLLPAQHGATHPRTSESEIVGLGGRPALPLRTDVETLAERLRSASFRTAAIVANDVYLNRRYGLHRGFEHYDDRRGGWVEHYLALAQFAGATPRTGHLLYRDAERITDLALEWFDSWLESDIESDPFFLMLNYMDAHAPYLPPPPHDRAFVDARPVDPLRVPPPHRALQYDRELRFLDAELERLIAGLESRGLLDDTVVILTSDHGEALGQHGFWRHGWTLYDSVIRVPLIVKPVGPRGDPVSREPIGGAAVHDLALVALGLERLAVGSPGPVDGEWFQVEDLPASQMPQGDLARDLVSWMEGTTKFIVTSRGDVEAFDVTSDPGEEHPLPLDDARVAKARERARSWWQENPPPVDVQLDELGSDTLERLRGLGYTGGPDGE